MTARLELYTGPHCELCEVAKDVIYQSLTYGNYELSIIDVTASLELKKSYGLRIPVVRNTDTQQELGWPFTPEQLIELVSS